MVVNGTIDNDVIKETIGMNKTNQKRGGRVFLYVVTLWFASCCDKKQIENILIHEKI